MSRPIGTSTLYVIVTSQRYLTMFIDNNPNHKITIQEWWELKYVCGCGCWGGGSKAVYFISKFDYSLFRCSIIRGNCTTLVEPVPPPPQSICKVRQPSTGFPLMWEWGESKSFGVATGPAQTMPFCHALNLLGESTRVLRLVTGGTGSHACRFA